LRGFLAVITCLALAAGCSVPNSSRYAPDDSSTYNAQSQENYSDAGEADIGEIRAALKDAESYYTEGVIYYQKNQLDSSKLAFEEALLVLSDLDFDAKKYSSESRWMQTLLNEIEADYRLTLMTSGVLYSDGSAAAFRDLFSDIKNFRKLKESEHFHRFEKDSITYDVPIVINDKVENSLAYLQTVAHDTFEKYLSRSGRYMPSMEKILAEEGVPHDLVYLPLIESGFNAHAYSYARAVGFWQFIYSTGKRYGMRREWWYDERRDFEKSTRAAARYLKDLYDEFGSWELALAGYNGGEGRVRKEIRNRKTKDFWKLRLKKQTRDYVPLFMAATIIAKEPEKYGFYPTYEQPLAWEVCEVSKCISFSNISEKTGISVADLELLNPELLRGMTPPGKKNYQLRVPVGAGEKFLAAYDDIPSEKSTNWVQHKVRRGQTVSTIARAYGVSMSSIISANNLRRPYRIYAGQTLMIPTVGGGTWTSAASDIVPDGSGTYVVKRGDTLWEIARAHNVTLTGLKNANRLTSNRIYPGRKLIIPGKGSSAGNSNTTYIVRAGDTLSKIARKYGIPIKALRTHNRLRSDIIYPGMRLKIPLNISSIPLNDRKNSPTIYKVKKGDTLWKISRLFGVSTHDLIVWNNISNPSSIRHGETLKIYSR
jgi:membrane-bound lytic murein transglycosylase D